MIRSQFIHAGSYMTLGAFCLIMPLALSAQYCTPGANCSDGDQVENFIFNTISNLNSGGSNCNTTSYVNTGLSTTVTVGNRYAIGIQAGTSWAQGFGVWIDYNQDGDFDDLDEFIYASPSASLNWFNDSVLISSAALPGSTRLRVRSRYSQTITAGQSCTNFTWGETEDYFVNIIANSSPPVANFMAASTYTCNGVVNFTDMSLNAPTSWSWDFGDGTYAAIQNPSHTYGAPGTYSVKLLVTNAYGADSLLLVNYITVSLSGPIAASCTPSTTSYCCQMGIYNVTFDAINNNSGDGSAGYEDFSCSGYADLTMNLSYSISVETGPDFEENVAVWIDYNNDGIFTGGEQVFVSYQVLGVHTGSILIPSNPVANTGLRMRVGSDWWQNPVPAPCLDVTYGQFEDYSVVIHPDTVPPVANFTASATLTCSGVIDFTDLSTISPTSWFWDFGDGFTDTTQNPSHTYTADGTYTVTLAATNQYGSDTVVFVNYIQVNLSGGGPTPASCTPATLNYCCGFGITTLNFNTINSNTVDGAAGYEDLTCVQGTNVVEGQVYNFFADMSGSSPGLNNIRAWIDYNNDGLLDNVTELAYSDDNVATSSGTITIASGGILNTALRMRVSADYDFEAVPTPCNDLQRGQAEDYSITVLANSSPPVAGFSAVSTESCDGAVSFIDESGMVPTFWLWDFGDGQTSNLQNPVHVYLADGIYTVTLVVANTNGNDTLARVDYVSVALGTGPVAASCTPNTLTYCCGYGTYNITFSSISNPSGSGAEGYRDFSCTQKAYVVAGQSYGLSVTTGISNPQDTRAWIDYNNDGVLDDITERVFTADDDYNPAGIINIPLIAVQDTALRFRISSDFSGSAPGPCDDPWYGQVEDYAIVVGLPPNSDFSASDSVFCENTCISFTDLSTDDPASWNWSFPGASPSFSLDQHPANICYSNPGTYNVSLTTTNNFGSDIKVVNSLITVQSCPAPAADFSADASGICVGECLNFSDLTANNPDTWTWYFQGADIDSSSDQDPAGICYSTPGTYDVSLVVTNAYGMDSINKAGFITVNSCPPAAAFTSSTTSVCETACAAYTDQSANNPTSWSWTFSGGTPGTSNAKNPMGICYAAAGTYDVTLIVGNASGTDTLVMANYITVVSCPPPTAAFAPSDSEICPGDCITFSDFSQNAITWFWSFEDGTPSSAFSSNPGSVCFSGAPGFREVRLVTTNALGSDTATKAILLDSAVAAIGVADTLYQNVPAAFTDNSVNPAGWLWNFGDGNSTGTQNPYYAYSNTGVYTVILIMTNNNGCVDTATKDLVVIPFTGMELLIPDDAMPLYPNPAVATVHFNLSFPVTETTVLTILNTLGEEVYRDRNYQQHHSPGEINISFLPKGLYYITISNNMGFAINKFIRQ